MNLKLKTTTNGNNLVDLQGELDAIGTQTIRPALEDLIENLNQRHLVIDLSRVVFIDSSGIGALVFLFKRLRQRDKTMEIIGVQGQPRELFELLRIHKAIHTSWMQAA